MSMYTKPYLDYKTFLKQRYGAVLQRVPVDLNLGCPNRDHMTLEGGCLFCGESGARATHLKQYMNLEEQVIKGIEVARRRYGATDFMAYFQAYTSTNAPIDQLRAMFSEVLKTYPFRAVTISTRPDCLSPEVLDYLEELAAQTDLWVELGIQTANDTILAAMNRGHDFACSAEATQKLASRGIHVAAHVILGLPGESINSMWRTADELAKLPLNGIKIHNLHIVAGSQLESPWRAGSIPVWDEHEYGEVLMGFLRRVPQDWVVMRVLSDTPNNLLLAPHWWLNKAQFLEYLEQQMQQRGWHQGDLLQSTKPPHGHSTPQPPALPSGPAQHTQPPRGTIQRLNLSQRFSPEKLNILHIGTGPCHLSLECLDGLAKNNHPCVIQAMSLHLRSALNKENYPTFWQDYIRTLAQSGTCTLNTGQLSFRPGDPRQLLATNQTSFDVILLEPSHVEASVTILTVEFCQALAEQLSPKGILISNRGSNALWAALLATNWHISILPAENNCPELTLATRAPLPEHPPLPDSRLKVLNTTNAGIPYRDPDLNWTRKQILKNRLTTKKKNVL